LSMKNTVPISASHLLGGVHTRAIGGTVGVPAAALADTVATDAAGTVVADTATADGAATAEAPGTDNPSGAVGAAGAKVDAGANDAVGAKGVEHPDGAPAGIVATAGIAREGPVQSLWLCCPSCNSNPEADELVRCVSADQGAN